LVRHSLVSICQINKRTQECQQAQQVYSDSLDFKKQGTLCGALIEFKSLVQKIRPGLLTFTGTSVNITGIVDFGDHYQETELQLRHV
jgi:hypothetical protein